MTARIDQVESYFSHLVIFFFLSFFFFFFSSSSIFPIRSKRWCAVVSLFSWDSRALLFDARQKREREHRFPDAMYGNLYVSGPVGSDATANNPLPTTTSSSTATTRTHNQPQQPHLPISTVATAALQNNRDDPHLAGNEACLCSLCHIKDSFFPRSQDGRIVLPQPTMSMTRHPTPIGRIGRSASSASMTSASPLATSALPTHRRNRTDSTASNRDDRE